MTAAELVKYGWAKGVNARNAEGDAIDYNSPKAVAWCLLGALAFAYEDLQAFLIARAKVGAVLNNRGIPNTTFNDIPDIASWNDATCRTKEEVIAVLEEAGV